MSNVCKALMNGVELAFRQLRDIGDLSEKIRPEIYDDACDASQAIRKAIGIFSTDTRFVIVHLCSDATSAALNIYRAAGMLHLIPAATSNGIHLSDNGLQFRICGNDGRQAELMIDYATAEFPRHAFAIVAEAGVTGDSQKQALLDRLKHHRRKTCKVLYIERDTNLAKIFRGADSNYPRAIFYAGHNAEIMRRVLLHLGVTQPNSLLLCFEAGGNVDLTGLSASARRTLRFVRLLPNGQNTGSDDQFQQYRLLGQAAGEVLLEALTRSASPKPPDVAMIIHGYQFETCIGRLSFDSDGESSGHHYAVVEPAAAL
ncbi:ABC transporter substrate-binding protein [Sneathiella chungangensis]|uniref:ABC transporter substrate-binding protein n=2 Tax=Sneathiella chungangensis TaxID=1418234 RepID=A0A845MKR4_9PROT|nr:ABC transporter substrate-binding protein [Sneathiella chungangensis]